MTEVEQLEAAIIAAATTDARELAKALLASGWRTPEVSGKLTAGDYHFNERTGSIAYCPNTGCPLGDVPHWESETAAALAIEEGYRRRLAAGEKLKVKEWTVISKLAVSEDLLTLVVTTRPLAQWANVYYFSRNKKTPAAVLLAGLSRGFETSHPEAWAEALCYAGTDFVDEHLSASEKRAMLEADPYRVLVYRRDEATAREVLAYLASLIPEDPKRACRYLSLIQNAHHGEGFAEERERLYRAAEQAARHS